jgi:hypothetical protein
MEEIERAAERVLAAVPSWVWDGERLPVPVEEIADTCFGLLVREVDDLSSAPGVPDLAPGQTFSGLLLPDRGEIWVNAEEAAQWPGRRRFTVGHELGHHCLHRHDGEAVFCRHGGIQEADPGSRPAVPEREEEANVFSAALCMPAELVRREYKRGGGFERWCRRFGVSGAAMGRRLHAVIT